MIRKSTQTLMRSSLFAAIALLASLSVTPAVATDSISAYLCAKDWGARTDRSYCKSSFSSYRYRHGHGRGTNKGNRKLRRELKSLLSAASNGQPHAFTQPYSWDLSAIPQDPANPLNKAKVKLGKHLFHETALATNGVNPATAGTWSCASCHHAAAGFKAGGRQGIGEGGEGFGRNGSKRVPSRNFYAGDMFKPDIQPVASPTILNSAYQDVMLWNGQFGNAPNGIINSDISPDILMTEGTPKTENARNLSGLETQAVAGLGVHRLQVAGENSAMHMLRKYRRLYRRAFPNGGDKLENAGLAIAAYERTVLANRAPFQRFLRGKKNALSKQELRGAIVFFGTGQCADCHRGPALSSEVGATEYEMFFALGFDDFDPTDKDIQGPVTDNDRRGRGGFTRDAADNYKFKIPSLYNLADTNVFGHGASFASVREVVEYKLAGVPQVLHEEGGYLDPRFTNPPVLTEQDVDDLVMFLENGLYDANLQRYAPRKLPSGNCFPVADALSAWQLGC